MPASQDTGVDKEMWVVCRNAGPQRLDIGPYRLRNSLQHQVRSPSSIGRRLPGLQKGTVTVVPRPATLESIIVPTAPPPLPSRR
jgi:hypothetical protein